MTDHATDSLAYMLGGRGGKSLMMDILLEHQLKAGLTVAVYTRSGFRVMKRFKHLTRIWFTDAAPKKTYW